MKALIGRKIGMTTILREDGEAVGVTLIQAGPCVVTGVKTEADNGYDAIALGFGEAKNPSKPEQGQSKQAKLSATPAVIKEFRNVSSEEATVGASFDVTAFEEGDTVSVTGTSKGKGFAGTIKRHNFARGPVSHGSKNVRQPGSIGSMYPQKIFKGKKMAGQMGGEQVTVKNLTVALVDLEQGVIGIRGAVPGPRKSIVTIREVA